MPTLNAISCRFSVNSVVCSIGDTFLYNSHLCIIISDPSKNPDEIVMAWFTTWEAYKDQACILYCDDHPFVKHETCINYESIYPPWTQKKLRSLIESGKVQLRERVSQQVLEKIIKGADSSRFIPNKCWVIMDKQGLFS